MLCMKKRIYFIFFSILFLSPILLNGFLINTNDSESNINSNIISADIGGYPEEDFVPISVAEENITFPDVFYISTVTQFVEVYTNVTYTEDNNTWVFNLPANFDDATQFSIKRSYLEIYYPLEDDLLFKYTGISPHFDITSTTGQSDILNFSVKLPSAEWSVDYDTSNSSVREYLIEISRFEEIRRSYDNVIFEYSFLIPFEEFQIQIFNETGGIEENVTDLVDLNYTLTERDFGVEMSFEFWMGYIQNETDYTYRFILLKEIAPQSFTDSWLNFFFPMLVGALIGALLPYLFRRRFSQKDLRNFQIWAAIGGAVIATFLFYLVFNALN